ncbi:Microtubule-associated proteins 70-5 isoform 1 [Hibiscus syriacus]|uniref:Microtubule-associated proteins 70-5 isoform 1 n=1 Tax=Hibiscus syriacus TaxID=106335 RepID=A0A6A3BG72_HIBSY|nr:uncharacterized protein LOC120217456 [Hibiscus syriacus]KAE8714871.1 Microtubule-associated proteins 70-5 isoform 1 [Hibiscus syriacus]
MKPMDIQQKLNQYRYHFIVTILASSIVAVLAYAAPSLLTVLAYFWPLFASTTVLLVLIVAFGGVSQLATEDHGEKAGEGLLDYVAAARPEHTDAEPRRFE